MNTNLPYQLIIFSLTVYKMKQCNLNVSRQKQVVYKASAKLIKINYD